MAGHLRKRLTSSHRRGAAEPPDEGGIRTTMSETPDTELAAEPVAQLPYLIGVRMRVPLQAEDHLTDHEDLAVGDFVVVETGQGTAVGEIRRPKRPLPEFKRGRLYRQVVRRATDAEVAERRVRPDRQRHKLRGLRGVRRGGGGLVPVRWRGH